MVVGSYGNFSPIVILAPSPTLDLYGYWPGPGVPSFGPIGSRTEEPKPYFGLSFSFSKLYEPGPGFSFVGSSSLSSLSFVNVYAGAFRKSFKLGKYELEAGTPLSLISDVIFPLLVIE